LPSGGNFAEHVFVEIAFGVAVFHGDFGDEVDDAGKEGGGGDCEAGVLHVLGIVGAVAAEFAEEGKDLPGDDIEHFAGVALDEEGPAEVVLIGGKEAAGERLFEAAGFGFFEELEVVEAAEEEEVGDLLDDFERVGDAAGPEGVPDAVDLVADFAGEHGGVLKLSW
jgi:hypothetical protein